jgi:hypothetical protein
MSVAVDQWKVRSAKRLHVQMHVQTACAEQRRADDRRQFNQR